MRKLSSEMNMPLTFATFYTCGIKRSTTLTQRECINLLLRGNLGSGSINILSDSVCSHYAKGSKPLTSDLRVELLNLTKDETINRLNKLNIQNFTVVANALCALVMDSSLPDNGKEALVKYYDPKNELSFIAEVFLSCLKGNNLHSLNQEDIITLEGYRHIDSSAILERINRRNTSVSDSQANATPDENENEDFDWMRNYVPISMINPPPAFVRGKVRAENAVIELPNDYSAMIYSLKPTVTESAFEKFTVEELTKAMDIDTAHNSFILQKGSLEYWQFEGAMESMLPLLKSYNFSEVSDFAFQLIGDFALKDVTELIRCLKDLSNDNVDILTSLIIDKALVNVKLTLIVHKCHEKVEDQKFNKDHDGTHTYKLNRSNDKKI